MRLAGVSTLAFVFPPNSSTLANLFTPIDLAITRRLVSRGRPIAILPVTMPSEVQVDGLIMTPEVSSTAEAVEQKADALPKRQYCLFRSGRERYCLPVAEVEEVVDWPTLTRIPLVPPFLKGIFNLRGVIIPVLDIAYQEDRRADSTPTHLVVAAWGRGTERGILRVGLTADEMFGTYLTSEPLLVEEAPKDAVHCRGMLRHETKLALALDLSRLAEAFPIPII